jgi:hypothetical protein
MYRLSVSAIILKKRQGRKGHCMRTRQVLLPHLNEKCIIQ